MGNFSSNQTAHHNPSIIAETKPEQQHKKQKQQQSCRSVGATPKNCLPLLSDGKFDVACADIMVGADSQDPENGCGIYARIFYPAHHDPEKVASTNGTTNGKLEYLPWRPESSYIEGLAKYRGMSLRKINFFMWGLGDKRVPVFWHFPLAAEEKFPVVIFSHGISGNRLFYTTFCASLASHGYVVAALEHRDGSSCWTYDLEVDEDGNFVKKDVDIAKLPHDEQEYEMRIAQVNRRVVETIRMLRLFDELNKGLLSNKKLLLGKEFAWEQFTGKLDLTNAVSIGHSFGGASALTACAINKSFKSCVLLDGWLYPVEQHHYAEITQPVLMLCASKWQWPKNVKRLLHLQKQGGGVGKQMYTMHDIVHQSFSDFGFLLPGYVGRYFGLQGLLDPEFTGKIVMEFVVKFLQDPIGSSAVLREIIAKHEFILEGTDVPMEKLNAIDEESIGTVSAETGEEEEKKIVEGGEVDASEAK